MIFHNITNIIKVFAKKIGCENKRICENKSICENKL
jgi:hypothetical protein